MGSFEGHLIPGIFFIIYGLWWCLNSMCIHLNSNGNQKCAQKRKLQSGDKRFLNTSSKYGQDMQLNRKSWIPAFFLPRIPVEPFLKVLLSSLGIFVEAFMGLDDNHHIALEVYHIRTADGTLRDLGKLYHVILYFGFLLSGIVDFLTLCIRFHAYTSTIFLSLSFFSEGLLFYFHTMGRDQFNIVTHLLLVYAIASSFLFTLLRLYSPDSLPINLGLGNSILLQGTWLILIGYFLFGGFLCEDEEITHEHIMLVIACFAVNIFIIAFGNLILLGFLSFIKKRWPFWMNCSKNRRNTQTKCGNIQTEESCKLIEGDGNDTSADASIEMDQIKY